MLAVRRTSRTARPAKRRQAVTCPPLENGDMLPLSEFLRRYEDMPGVKKAQLIEGVVHTPSPVRVAHAEPDGVIQLWLGTYAAENGLKIYPNASTASIDLRDKLRVYRRLEVQEYIVWRTDDAEIDWFVLEEGQYIKMSADRHGKLRSRVFPGLVLDLAAALACDKAKVLAALRK